MKKTVFVLSTFAIMLIVSRFIVRIVDATVQIDDDIGILLLLLLLLNAVIGLVGYKLYRAEKKVQPAAGSADPSGRKRKPARRLNASLRSTLHPGESEKEKDQ